MSLCLMEVGDPTGEREECAGPIEGVTMEASRAGTEGLRGRTAAEEARQGTDKGHLQIRWALAPKPKLWLLY